MLSFVGWEAVAPLTGRLRAGQLSRVIGMAFTVTAVLYLGLAVATISCLGRGADLSVPLADLLQLAIGHRAGGGRRGRAGPHDRRGQRLHLRGDRDAARAHRRPSQMRPNGPGRPPRLSAHALLGIIALAGLLLIGLSALRLADIIALVSVPTAMFLCVYLSCTASAVRILAGPRAAAAVAVLAVLAVLAFCGWQALLAVAVVAAVAALATPSVRRLTGYPPAAGGIVTRTVSSLSPRSSTARTVPWPSRFSSSRARPVLLTTPTPLSEISRSPRSMPAVYPALSGATAATSSPVRSDSPTAWRRARASRAFWSVRPS